MKVVLVALFGLAFCATRVTNATLNCNVLNKGAIFDEASSTSTTLLSLTIGTASVDTTVFGDCDERTSTQRILCISTKVNDPEPSIRTIDRKGPAGHTHTTVHHILSEDGCNAVEFEGNDKGVFSFSTIRTGDDVCDPTIDQVWTFRQVRVRLLNVTEKAQCAIAFPSHETFCQ